MFDFLYARKRHGIQYVKSITESVVNERYRGFPLIDESASKEDFTKIAENCPLSAIDSENISIDLGKCNFCGTCTEKGSKIQFSNKHKTGTDSREKLIIKKEDSFDSFFSNSVNIRKEIKRLFSRSLKLRSVSAGGCNACEMELNACGNVNFDMGRYGIEVTASPRHADGIVITGPVSANMSYALEETLSAVPEPRIIIAMGTCAISGGLFSDSPDVDRSFFQKHKVDLYIPGCPPHPLTFVNALIRFVGRKYE
ncbi:MAG: NADH:ubiquinone oxidoreductase [Spirochaetes bacterium]|nr:NADH:ubiquinone oxidoreductase [Spirochaetota bacterium]